MSTVELALNPAPMDKGRFQRWASSPWFWAFFLVLGLATRSRQFLHAHSFWYDEAFLVLAVQERSYSDLIGPQPYNLVIPPAYLWLERAAFDLFGDSETSMRLTAFLAGIVALLVMIPLARMLIRTPHSLWAFALFAGGRQTIAHGCDVRPYTLDLLCGELILLCSAVLILSTSRQWKTLATIGLGTLAILSPWLSFSSAFVLLAASLALGLHAWCGSSRTQWWTWGAFNALCAISGLAMWWFHASHMYYSGMISHWGHEGWKGFPNWDSFTDVITWTLTRPMHIGNYGTRDLGWLLYLLAIPGGFVLAKRSRPILILMLGPYLISLGAALVGKYPLVHRTSLFLLPCLWILAANGMDAVVRWAHGRGRDLMVLGFILIAWDTFWLGKRIVTPESSVNYRAAYAYVEQNRKPDELLWSQLQVVYQTYHGKEKPLVSSQSAARRMASQQPMWAVFSGYHHHLLEQFRRAGGVPIEVHQEFEGLWVVRLQPQNSHRGTRMTTDPHR